MTREQLESATVYIAQYVNAMVKEEFGTDVGFMLALFDFGESGSLAYAGTAPREDAVRALRELIEKMEHADNTRSGAV